VRVRSGDGGILGASSIIPPAERFGLIKFVDIRVLELALTRLSADPAARLSVNISMRTALTTEWLTAIESRLFGNPELAGRLIIEVTETAAMADLEATAAMLAKMKSFGCQVAIDDFGSGHTSFRSLRGLPLDILKIDGVFVQNITRSTDDRFFVRTLLDLAKHLKVKTVAEWVQDAEAAAMLAEWGIDYLQGEFCGHAAVEDGALRPGLRASA
jgi:EAL domain-containing protein (putative c-di-GMP-specific phosphodiesterase class I)